MADEEKVERETTEEQKNKETEEPKEEEKTEEKVVEKAEEKVEKKPLDEARGKEEKKPEPSGKFKNIIKDIESLSVLELAELVKELEERFGVSAAAPVAVAAAGAPAAGAAAEEEKSAYTVHLADAGAQKIAVIKAVRVIRQDLGLKEAKDLVDGAPKDVKADMPKAEAEEAKKNLEAAGAKVELK